YLHSALQQNRVGARGARERHTLLMANRWDCVTGLGLAGLVNLAMLCVAAALFHGVGTSGVVDLGVVHTRVVAVVALAPSLSVAHAIVTGGTRPSPVLPARSGQRVFVTAWRPGTGMPSS